MEGKISVEEFVGSVCLLMEGKIVWKNSRKEIWRNDIWFEGFHGHTVFIAIKIERRGYKGIQCTGHSSTAFCFLRFSLLPKAGFLRVSNTSDTVPQLFQVISVDSSTRSAKCIKANSAQT